MKSNVPVAQVSAGLQGRPAAGVVVLGLDVRRLGRRLRERRYVDHVHTSGWESSDRPAAMAANLGTAWRSHS